MLFCLSIFSIFNILGEEHHQEKIKNELIEQMNIPKEPSLELEFSINFEYLKSINSDIVGWIVMKGTQVNYAVVQGNNNSYYLNHSYDRKYSSYGSIFLDYSSSEDFSDRNSFVYGHHTRNGSMFGEVKKYMDYNFYVEYPSFYLYTPGGNYKADIFSAYTADALSDSYNQSFLTVEEYKIYIDMVKSKSRYITNVTIDYENDKIISLYSCSQENGSRDDRYFIHAVLKKLPNS